MLKRKIQKTLQNYTKKTKITTSKMQFYFLTIPKYKESEN